MGWFGKKKSQTESEKARPTMVGAQAVSGPGAQYTPPSAPDLEDPPLVEAWVVPDAPARSVASPSQIKSGGPPPGVGAFQVNAPAPNLYPPAGQQAGVVALPDKKGGKGVPDKGVDPRAGLVGGQTFKRKPMMMDVCPNCNTVNTRTRIRTYPSLLTWLAVVVILLLFWPLAWVPLVWDKFKKTDHMCVSCNSIVGSVGPMSDCCERSRE